MSGTEPVPACWCGVDEWAPSGTVGGFRRCAGCGTLVAPERLRAGAEAEFYGFAGYWRDRQRAKGHPAFAERARVYAQDGRLALWRAVLAAHGDPGPARLLEIGCAEGALLASLAADGWEVLGIEPDPATAAAAREASGVEVCAGVFPAAAERWSTDGRGWDWVLACDVLEHAADPRAFLAAAHRLLRPGGHLLLQLPLVEGLAGAGPELAARVCDAPEHVHIFTRSSLAALLAGEGFEVRENADAWAPGHEIVVAQRPAPGSRPGTPRLGNLGEMFSASYRGFMAELNAFARPLGLRTFVNWSKIWEYPKLAALGLGSRELERGTRVVDLGSELSPLPWLWAAAGARVTLVERTADFVPHWEQLQRRTGWPVDWVVAAEGDTLPLPTGSADVVLSLSVLEHQSDPALALAEAWRVLRPGGRLGVSFDLCEPAWGMTYPPWGGRPATLAGSERLLWSSPFWAETTSERSYWNTESLPSFLSWHRTTAAHHRYAVAAGVFSAQSEAKRVREPRVPIPSDDAGSGLGSR